MDLAVAFRSDNPVMVGLAKELLHSNDIEFMVRNEGLQNIVGMGSLGAYNLILGPIEILVREEDRAAAEELLRDLTDE